MDISYSHYKVFLLSSAIFSLVLGLFLLIGSNLFIRLNEILNKWISTEKFRETLEKPRDIDKYIINMIKILSLVCIVLGLVFIFLFVKV